MRALTLVDLGLRGYQGYRHLSNFRLDTFSQLAPTTRNYLISGY